MVVVVVVVVVGVVVVVVGVVVSYHVSMGLLGHSFGSVLVK